MSDGRLAGKTIMVTGAGRGIGAAIARLAAVEGAAVLVNDIDAEPAELVAAGIRQAGGQAVAQGGNIADWGGAGQAVQAAIDEFGALDGLVNNAGVFGMALAQHQDPDEFRRLIETNVFGVAYPGLHAIRHMVERGQGSIVNVTSSVISGMPSMGGYGASKGAVAALTFSWALDLAGTGVRVNGLSPIAQTRMQNVRMDYEGLEGEERAEAERQRTVEPEFNAPPAVYLLSDRSAHLTGQILQIGRPDQLSLLAPSRLVDRSVTLESGSVAAVERAFSEVFDAELPWPGISPQRP